MTTLRECRRRKLMSIADLAAAAGVSTRTIVDIEHGRTVPRLVTIRKIAQTLEVAPEEIEEFRRAIRGEEAEGKELAAA